jgi:NAD(P)-dependent dehydrogenase (short-subunit alcohol dehydrogenase family)
MRILVTGATDGVGKQVTMQLARLGHSVVVHGRNEEKVKAVAAEAAEVATRGANIQPVVAAFDSLHTVKKLADEIRVRFPDLDVLVNNAATWTATRELTADGLETSFAVNHLAPLLLTDSLVPLLSVNGAALKAPRRVVIVASNAHLYFPTMTKRNTADTIFDWDNLQAETHYESYPVYAQSKLANVMMMREFARRHPVATSHITFNAVTPGVVDTKLLRTGLPHVADKAGSVVEGAMRVVRIAVDSTLADVTGRYFSEDREADVSPLAADDALCRRMWQVSHDLIHRATA